MYFLNHNLVLLSVIFSGCSLILSASSKSFNIVDCKANWETTTLDSNDTIEYNGKIDAELDWNKIHGVALVKKVTFSGTAQYKEEPMKEVVMDVSSLKEIRIQRFIEYDREGFNDIVTPQCSLGFIYDDDVSLNVPVALEYELISHAENCIEDQLCKFDPENHRMGDDIHVISKSHQEKNQITTQVQINAVADFGINKLVNDLVKANKSRLALPELSFSLYPIEFSSSGGSVDILKYVKRAGDLSFLQEGQKYFIESAFGLTAGHIQLNNVSVSSPMGNFVNGEVRINVTGATLRMTVAFDYNKQSCEVSVPVATLSIPPDQVDFTSLKIEAWFVTVTVESVLNTLFLKSLTINAIENQVAGMMQDLAQRLNCENYRNILLKFGEKN